MTRHVILGGNGVVGAETITALRAQGEEVASVGRAPNPNSEVTSILADLRDPDATRRAVEGAEVAYLTVGLPYRTRVWRRDWPTIMRNAIAAAIQHTTHLVYFDNVYAYGRVDGPMTEETPIRPSSAKGQLRAELLRMLDAGRERGLEFTIGRSADFYGPGASTSSFNTMALDRVAAGQEPTWLIDSDQPHSMTYTRDIGPALAKLGTDERARGRVWHLPTAPARTGEEYLAMASGRALRHRVMSLATMRFGALFVPIARESLELSYQNSSPYVFDSSRYEATFGVSPTPYPEAITQTLDSIRG
ncbi:NAD-dependent epimerase/dehydratase family protein [Homoserinimonas sp. A447]